jgi:hypothetical protein
MRVVGSGTIVMNRNLDPSIVVVNLDACLGSVCMPHDVRQGLPSDAIHRRSSLARNRLKIIRQGELDSETGCSYGLDELG